MQIIDAGAFTITTGIYRGREHVYVTHRDSGKQWVGRSEYDGRALDGDDFSLKSLIECRVIQFFPTSIDPRSRKPRPTCDLRFWEPVATPVIHPRSEFDALCFIGD